MVLLVAANQALVGLLLPWVMGQRVSPSARHVQRFFMFQAATWAVTMTAHHTSAPQLQSPMGLGAVLLALASLWSMAQALQLWLGRRPLRKPAALAALLGVLSFVWHWGAPAMQWAWFSLFHSLVVLAVALMCLNPVQPTSRGWRLLLYGSLLAIACDLVTRSVWLLEPAHLSQPESSWQPGFALLALCSNTLILAATLIAWRDESSQQLREQAMTDQLTNLANRRALLQAAPRMLEHAQRHHLPLALLILDLDHFKQVNDQHGHAVGDQALQLFARVLQQQVRNDEIAARWGGEEFCVLMHADAETAHHFFDRLAHTLHARSVQELGFALGLSAGASCLGSNPSSLHSLMVQADTALYQAKGEGRGRLVFAQPAAARTSPPLEQIDAILSATPVPASPVSLGSPTPTRQTKA